MERRDFIKGCAAFCIGGTVLSILLSGCSQIYYATSEVNINKIRVSKSEFIDTNKKLRKFVVVRHDKLQFPVCIYKFGDAEYVALFMQCSHRGCELQPNKSSLVCPCHGSEFSDRGKVLSPPADKDLKQFKVTTDNENIYVEL